MQSPPLPGKVAMLRVTGTIAIDEWELTELFTGASGPGGQNVNKLATAVELRFAAATSPNLPGPVKHRLRRCAGRRWTRAGEVVIRAGETRSQARNREIARRRLAELIAKAAEKPRRRIPTKAGAGAERRRREAKMRRSRLKSLRGRVDPGD